jgi:hypothetical protein
MTDFHIQLLLMLKRVSNHFEYATLSCFFTYIAVLMDSILVQSS